MLGEKYQILCSAPYSLGDYSVVSLRQMDIFDIMHWRNSQIDVLRQKTYLTRESQLKYYNEVIRPSYSQQTPAVILLSLLQHDKLVGYGGLVHIDWEDKRAEVSFLTSLDKTIALENYTQDFTAFLTILKQIAFRELHFKRLSTETFDIRPHVIKILENNGFSYEGRLKSKNFIQEQYVDSILHSCLSLRYSAPNQVSPGQEIDFTADGNVLVTSISRKVPLLNRIKKQLKSTLPNALVYGGDANPHCLGQFFVDHFWACPDDSILDFDLLVDFCQTHRINTIFPTRDGELPFYAKIAEKLKDKNIHVMVSSVDAVNTCLDKLEFYIQLSSLDTVSVIPTSTTPNQALSKQFVVKERFGSGTHGMALNVSADQAERCAATMASPVFQPYIDGIEYSIDMFISQNLTLIASVVRRRDVVINGEAQITTIVSNSKLESTCYSIAKYLQLNGHLVFQAIQTPHGSFFIIECNCRMGGASTLSMKAGIHSIAWFINEKIKKRNIEPVDLSDKAGMRLIRVPHDTFHEMNRSPRATP